MSLVHVVATTSLLTIVGAIIGGATNYIAIKMLFKPYYPVMIGKWRLPFTPGLIPMRHGEIAQELGRLVMKHLITADRLKSKLLGKDFSDQLAAALLAQLSDWLEKDDTMREQLAKWIDPEHVISNIEQRLAGALDQLLDDFFVSKEDLSLGEALPDEWTRRVEENLPVFARYIAESLAHYLESDEGKASVTLQLNQIFEGKGFFGNMLGLFLGNQSVIDKLYPELISFLSGGAFIRTIETLLKEEWKKWLGKSFGEVAEKIDLESTGKAFFSQHLIDYLPIRRGLEMKPRDVLGVWAVGLMEAVPKATMILLEKLAEKIPDILTSLDLEGLVTEQVRQFSIQELEDVVLIISKKEFKMITYLGALLGGLIGIVQAIIVIGMG